jgi:hypothetical protein
MQTEPNTASLAAQIQALVARLRDQRAVLTNERSTLDAERAELLAAPLSRDDSKALMVEYIDRQAATWNDTARWRDVFRELTYPNRYPLRSAHVRPGVGEVEPIGLADYDQIASGDSRSVLGFDGLRLISGFFDGLRLTDGALFALLGDQLKPKLCELFDRFYPEPLAIDAKRIGPPVAERRVRLEAIDERLGEIAAAVALIDQEASEVNADLTPLSPPKPVKASEPTPARERGKRKYTPGVVQQITGLSYAELARLQDLRPLPTDPDRVGEVFYCADEVERWAQAKNKRR